MKHNIIFQKKTFEYKYIINWDSPDELTTILNKEGSSGWKVVLMTRYQIPPTTVREVWFEREI